jgi:hypothetical protein
MKDGEIQTNSAAGGSYTWGSPGQYWFNVVPVGSGATVTSISVAVGGAAGGVGQAGPAAGLGGLASATIPVSPEWGSQPPFLMQLTVGGMGNNGNLKSNSGVGGYNGGGNGGAAHDDGYGGGGGGRSTIQLWPQGQSGPAGAFIVYAGGGGGSGLGCNGGSGGVGGAGGQNGGNGAPGVQSNGVVTCNPGQGAIGATPGQGGTAVISDNSSTGKPGNPPPGGGGGDGWGTSYDHGIGGGGGGAGYAGGGGGAGVDDGVIFSGPNAGGGGGGGGSCYVPVVNPSYPPTGVQYRSGAVSTAGFITITVNES